MASLSGTHVTWLGHATVLVVIPGGLTLLIDPFIEHNPKYPKDFKLPEKIDYVLLTHAHMDHMADAIPIAKKYDATVVAVVELANYVESKGVAKTVGINLGGSLAVQGATITMVEAKHTSSLWGEDQYLNVGVAAGFVLTIEHGPVLYHAGDTTVFQDMELIRQLYAPEVAMLPMGGHYTMGPKEAAVAVRILQPKIILPIHWGTFPPLIGTPQELAQLVGQTSRVLEVNPGESFEV